MEKMEMPMLGTARAVTGRVAMVEVLVSGRAVDHVAGGVVPPFHPPPAAQGHEGKPGQPEIGNEMLQLVPDMQQRGAAHGQFAPDHHGKRRPEQHNCR